MFFGGSRSSVLGGSWVVISRVISPLIWVISIVILLLTLLITTHEPPSTGSAGSYSVLFFIAFRVLGSRLIGLVSLNGFRK